MQTNIYLTPDNKLPCLPSYAYQGFPVRNIKYSNAHDGGAWLVEYKAEKKNELRSLKKHSPAKKVDIKSTQELTGCFLIKHCYIDDPKDVCILNISGKDLVAVEKEDFSLFENVVHIDASDNNLTFDVFKSFPSLEDLELQVNKISCIHLKHKEFTSLMKLDLSYNNLKDAALLNLGKLRNLTHLKLRGCGLQSLPPQLARGYEISDSDNVEKKLKAETKTRFPKLTQLDLSENLLTGISTFASLAGLRKLRFLNLSCNKIIGVPHLRLMAAHRHFSMSTCAGSSTDAQMQQQISNDVGTLSSDVRHDVSEVGFLQKNSNNSLHKIDVESAINERNCSNENKNSDDLDKMVKESTDFDYGQHNLEKENEKTLSGAEKETDTVKDGGILDDIPNEPVIEDFKDNVLDGIEKVLSRISNERQQEEDETSHLLDINFATELNFGVLGIDDDEFDAFSVQSTPPPPPPMQKHQVSLQKHGDSKQGQETVSEQPQANITDTVETTNNVVDEGLRRPFPHLHTLDLSYNQIKDEESLLALTAWPSLQELKLWGNPLMRLSKGIPPVLMHHLKVICGINIHRKEPKPEPKPIAPAMNNSTKVRRVKTDIPQIKRNNMLAIENMILQAIENKSNLKDTEGEHKKMGNNEGDVTEIMSNGDEEENTESFFLTQVNEEGIDENTIYRNMVEENDEDDEKETVQDLVLHADSILRISDDESTVDELIVPETVQGSVLALKHILNNELVFNAGHYNKNKAPLKQRKCLRYAGKKNVVDEALGNIRSTQNSHQENLEVGIKIADLKEVWGPRRTQVVGIVLEDFSKNPDIRQKFPHAKKMMNRVQHKYNEVRLKSLQPMSETEKELEKISTRTDQPSHELFLARMKHGKIGDFYTASRGNTPRVKIRGTRYEECSN